MREIIFRAISINKNKMVESMTIAQGTIKRKRDDYFFEIAPNKFVGVIPKTIGQFTGQKDVNGLNIFEGDVLKEGENRFEVVWDLKYCKFKLDHSRTNSNIQYPEWNRGVQMQVIGNVHENTELLKVK